MKNYYPQTRSFCVACVLLLLSLKGLAQYPVQTPVKTPINSFIQGYYEWLPPDYATNTSRKYPLLIFIHGIGELGNGNSDLPKVLVNGPPKLIQQQKFPTSFTVNGQEFSFIVISPQFTANIKNTGVFNSLITTLKQKYRVDENRIYLTGLSMGGGLSWWYSSFSKDHADGLAAMAVVCGNMDATSSGIANIALSNLPVKIFHNEGDPTVPVSWSRNWFNGLNSFTPAMSPKPRLTVWNSNSHDAWSKAYDPNYKEDNQNVYEWMLNYSRGKVTAPVNTPPTVSAGTDQTITLPTNEVTLNGTATDADGTIANMVWTKVSGPDNYTITSPNSNKTTVTGLTAGTYTFQFSATDNAGATSRDEVVVTVKQAANQPACKADAGPDQIIERGESAVLDGTGSIGSNLTYSWKLLTAVTYPCFSNMKNTDKPKADAIILPFVDGGYKYELTVSNGAGCVSKDTTVVKVNWGKMPPQSPDPQGWHVATATDVARIPTARIGDLIVEGANNGPGNGGRLDITILNQGAINLKPGQKILIRGGRYRTIRLNFNPGTVRGTKDNPVIITNFDGQVECTSMSLANAVGVKLTGRYVPGVSGDVNYQGHENGAYAFSRGKYGIFSNSTWTSLGSAGLRVMGPDTDSIEVEFMEIANGHFTGMMIKEDGGTKDYNDIYIHDVYIHDIHGEGVYLGSTGTDPQHQLNKLRFENVRIINAGNEIFQFNNVGYGSVVQNNVFINSANNRRSTFANYQDNGAQLAYRSGYQQFRNNIMLGTGNCAFNSFIGSKTGQPTPNDTIYVCNNLVKYGSGALGGYFTSSNALPTTIVKMDSNYFGGFEFTADEIFSDSRGVNTNTLIRIANGLQVVFRDNKSDGTKSVMTSGARMTANNQVTAINNPNFVNSGWPANFDYAKLTSWGDYIFNTWKDEMANQYGVKFNQPIVFNAGDYVTFLSKTYRSKVSNNHGHVPRGKTDEYWELITWSDGASTYTYPPDDYRLIDGDEYKKRNIGLLSAPVQPVPNNPPVADAGIDREVILPVDTLMLEGKGTDTDGSITTYQWTKIEGPDDLTITNGSTSTAILSDLKEGVYKLELLVVDDKGASATDTVILKVYPSNLPPVANAGADRTVKLPVDTLLLVGSGSDKDGSVAGYEWTKISGPDNYELTNSTSDTATVSNLEEGVYEFELVVIDDKGRATRDTVVITVVSGNLPPVANAGADRTIKLPVDTVLLAGSGTDSDGTIIGYEWTKISGPDNYQLSNATSDTAIVSNLEAGVYEFELVVIDNKGKASGDTVVITVQSASNKAPVSEAGEDIHITLPNNSTTLKGQGSDEDGTITSFKWTWISGPTTYNLVDSENDTTELTNLVEGEYVFELTVTDDKGAQAKDRVKVVVAQSPTVPNVAPIANAGDPITITLPQNSTNLTGTGTDTDGQIVSYLWRRVSGPTSHKFANANAASTEVSLLTQGTYQFELTVKDDKGATGKDTVTVTVNPAPNKAPTANAGTPITITLPKNNTMLNGSGTDSDGTITGYLWKKISGPASYQIASPNQASTEVTGLTAGTYQFELTVTDNNGATGKATVTVTVNPAPNKAPTANAGTDITITLPKNSTTLNGSGTDSDGTITGYLWKKVSGPASFRIGSPNQASTTVSELVEGTYQFELTVTDNKGATGKATVNVIVNPAPNKPPTANAGTDIVIMLPNTSAPLDGKGTDPDGTITKYQWKKISGPASYKIGNPNAAKTPVTDLVEGVYEFELTVTDNKGATASDVVKVTVQKHANKAPVANAGRDTTLRYPANSIMLDGSGSYDTDGQIVSYKWKKISGPNLFVILNENTARPSLSSMAAGTYVMELAVTDNENVTATDRVTIVVDGKIPDNKVPKANAGSNQVINLPVDSAQLDGSASSDEDGYIQSYQWKQKSGPSTAAFDDATAVSPMVYGLVAGEYVFELIVKDNKGTTSTATVTIKVVKVGSPHSNDALKLWPVPADVILNFKYEGNVDNKPLMVIVHDARGVQVFTKKVGGSLNSVQGTIDVKLLRSGEYYLSLRTEDGTIALVKKFVVVR
jgi:Predicted peptidase